MNTYFGNGATPLRMPPFAPPNHVGPGYFGPPILQQPGMTYGGGPRQLGPPVHRGRSVNQRTDFLLRMLGR